MRRHLLFWGLLALWAAAMVLSVVVPIATAPADFGFTRGMNRVSIFLQFQAAGLALGLALWVVGRGMAKGWRRGLSWLPLIVVLLQVLGAAGLVLWARLEPYPDFAPPPDRPVTQPSG